MTQPLGVQQNVSEIQPGDLWNPKSFDEWAARERLRVFLVAWNAQADHERRLRGKCAWMIFSLALIQTLGGIALLCGTGLQWLTLDPDLLKIVYVSVAGEIFGLFLVVARYLFSEPLKYTLDMFRETIDA